MLPLQCRMARAALNLGVRELAKLASVSTNTITRFEKADKQDEGDKASEIKPRTVAAIRAALELAGIEFINDDRGEGVVKLRS